MLEYERQAWTAGHIVLAGVDEAGRGPLAGPVVAAAVSIPSDVLEQECDALFCGLTDSKKLTVTKRDQFFDVLRNHPEVCIGVGECGVDEIDRLNILRATHLAMARAVEALPIAADHLLVDGRPVPGLPVTSTSIVKGDGLSLSIAAASVVAKVSRDKQMVEMDAAFPEYGFARHKGYGTKQHLAALREHGPTPHHRRSFAPVRHLPFGI